MALLIKRMNCPEYPNLKCQLGLPHSPVQIAHRTTFYLSMSSDIDNYETVLISISSLMKCLSSSDSSSVGLFNLSQNDFPPLSPSPGKGLQTNYAAFYRKDEKLLSDGVGGNYCTGSVHPTLQSVSRKHHNIL
ncbi:hypothetical protein J6590_095959 [Homalodisca vitripennis]|nr:hypothetical protein J6590_095959 [Homalodisca vitripennis]